MKVPVKHVRLPIAAQSPAMLHFVLDLRVVFHFSTYGTEGKYWIGLFWIGLILLLLKTAEVIGISGKRISLLLNSTAKCSYNFTS